MNTNTRLTLDDTVMTSIMKLAEGNPGAMRVCSEIMKNGEKIDPQGMGGFGSLLSIDSLGIYGSRIWLLYKDICRENLVYTIAVLRAWQLGLLPENTLQRAIDCKATCLGTPTEINPKELYAKVKERLGDFGGGYVEPEPKPVSVAVEVPVEVPNPSPSPDGDDRVINLD